MRMVRLAACGAGLWLLGVASPTLGAAQAVPGLQHRDRVRLAESIRLVKELRPGLWPGWERTRLSVLLVTESAEFLIGHSQPSAGFSSVGYDTLLKRPVWTRPRQFPPTLLATFPAVGGMPTIVLGKLLFQLPGPLRDRQSPRSALRPSLECEPDGRDSPPG